MLKDVGMTVPETIERRVLHVYAYKDKDDKQG